MKPAHWLGAAGTLLYLDSGRHPLTPGRIVYLLKAKFGHGVRVAYFRDVVRPAILAAPPLHLPEDRSCEIHVLTSDNDWLNLIWALRTFLHFSGRAYALCIHDDGSLDARACSHLRSAFPWARIVPRAESDVRLEKMLASFPRCRELRATNKLALKALDFSAFLEAPRMILLDSDILFFARPATLLAALHDPAFTNNTLNKDWRDGYTIDPAALRPLLGFDCPPLINSGLGLIHKDSLRLDWIEEFLALPGILSHSHQIEQTLIALCSAKFGFQMLPPEYDVHPGPRDTAAQGRHYAGPMRPLMYREGICELARKGFLERPTSK